MSEFREKILSYEDSLKYYRDLKNSLDTAFEEGRLEGKLEGKLEGLRAVVKNGIAAGVDVKTLANLTGLSEAEVHRIIDES